MVKSAFFVLALAGSAASASDILPASPLMGDVTRAQFMARQEALFTRLGKNGDGVIGESERLDIKANLEKRAMEAAQ
ncbi:hypothetical protein [Aeromonas caviae]|uniref:hypothetical protein n=1 Tax=Aeromonas caviae TaxID=648 RepID=UPI002B4A6E1A|nr:hypothetical protein [Aeromonas caviae]